jgi:hypothetical protein
MICCIQKNDSLAAWYLYLAVSLVAKSDDMLEIWYGDHEHTYKVWMKYCAVVNNYRESDVAKC